MLVGVSGPQGGGKTTLLNALRDMGYVLDDFKVSREVQRRLKVDCLDDLTKNPQEMMHFQEEVFLTKFEREQQNLEKGNRLLLVERTFADISSYAQLWAYELVHRGEWSLSEAMGWAMAFAKQCSKAQQMYTGVLHLPRMPHVQFENDPRRASQSTIEFIAEQLDRFYDVHQPREVKLFRISAQTVEDRATEVSTFLKGLSNVQEATQEP